MKKILVFILCAVIVLSLAACSQGATQDPTEEVVIIDDEPGNKVGGFERVDSPAVTEKVKTLLEKAVEDRVYPRRLCRYPDRRGHQPPRPVQDRSRCSRRGIHLRSGDDL